MLTKTPDLWDRLAAAKAKKWTPERVELLKKHWADGLSCSQIAKELRHVTRNAVIGKVHRLGLSGRDTKFNPAPRKPRPRRTAPIKVQRPALAPVLPFDGTKRTATACGIMGLTDANCHWPVGDVGDPDFFFCGAPAQEGKPYCVGHCSQAYKRTNNVSAADREQRSVNFVNVLRSRPALGTKLLRLSSIGESAA